jgi:hypothetical protein
MKYVILIHSNPQPWGHPTIDYTAAGRAIPADRRAESERAFDELLGQLSASGELVTAEALAAPQTSTVYRWAGDTPLPSEGPYAETKEHLAGFFLLDCATRERAEEIAVQFASPGDVIELRPAMGVGAEDG